MCRTWPPGRGLPRYGARHRRAANRLRGTARGDQPEASGQLVDVAQRRQQVDVGTGPPPAPSRVVRTGRSVDIATSGQQTGRAGRSGDRQPPPPAVVGRSEHRVVRRAAASGPGAAARPVTLWGVHADLERPDRRPPEWRSPGRARRRGRAPAARPGPRPAAGSPGQRRERGLDLGAPRGPARSPVRATTTPSAAAARGRRACRAGRRPPGRPPPRVPTVAASRVLARPGTGDLATTRYARPRARRRPVTRAPGRSHARRAACPDAAGHLRPGAGRARTVVDVDLDQRPAGRHRP